MSRASRIALLIAGILLASAVALTILVKIVVTPEKVRETVVPLAEKALHRDVSVKDIGIGLFSGVSLQDLKIRQKNATDDFVTLKSMDLHFQLLPLLTGQVVIDRIRIVDPSIVIIKNADGTFNFSDLSGNKPPAEEKPREAPPSKPEAPSSSGKSLNLQVDEVNVSGGSVAFIDRSKGSAVPTRYELNSFSLNARHVAFGKTFPIQVSATLKSPEVSLTLQASGNLALGGPHFLQSANLQVKELRGETATIKAGISGDIEYDGRQLKAEKLSIDLNGQQMQLAVQAANLFDNPVVGDFHLSGDTLNFNTLLSPKTAEATKDQPQQAPAPASPDKTPDARPTATAKEAGPFNLPLAMHGTIAINKVIYRQMDLDRLNAEIQLKDNRLRLSRLQGNLAGGELAVAANINLDVKGLSYQGNLDLERADAATLAKGFLPQAGNSITGQVQSHNTFSGRGTVPDSLMQALVVNGNTQVKNGRLTGAGLLSNLAAFLGNRDLEVIDFTTLQGTYELRDKIVHLNGDLDSSKLKLQPQGTVGLDGALDLDLNARLGPGIVGRWGGKDLRQMVTDQNGWASVPLKLEGTISSPRYVIDQKMLQKTLLNRAGQQLEQKLLKGLFGK